MKDGTLTFLALGALAIIGIIGFKIGQSFKTPEVEDFDRKETASIVEIAEPAWGDDPEVFTIVEQMPQFPGGPANMMQFISKNINYPPIAKENNIEGRVVIGFIVDNHGFIKDPEIKRDIGAGCGQEALRVVKSMPKWEPGFQKGEAVNVHFNLPVRFKLK